MHRLLIVEDSPEYQKVIARALGSYHLTCVSSAEEAWAALGKDPFDLVLLDISLPKRDGYSLLGDMQNSPELRSIPVICLTGKTQITDKVTAFSLGADDYLAKPFDAIELKIRVDAKILKHTRQRTAENRVSIGIITIDKQTHRVELNQGGKAQEIPLTQTEFKLLCKLTSRPDQVFSRDQLLVSAWGEDARVLDRTIDVHLCSLRKKLGPEGARIEAVAGVGYRFTLGSQSKKRKAA